MAEKVLQTRIINKHADLATWKDSALPLKTGEIALARVESTRPDGNGGFYKVPTYLMKVGDGEKTFSQLEWLAAPASDVYEWAKAATKPGYTATEIARGTSNVATDLKAAEDAITALQTAIGGSGSVATMIQTAIEALDVEDAAVANQFVTAVAEADGKISVTRRALTAEDIPALGIDKITGLQNALNLKANASDVKQTTDAISARLDKDGDIDLAIKAAKKAGDDAQSYAEGVNTAFGAYKTTNDAEVAAVKGIAEAAQTAQEVSDAIDAKISNYNNTTIKALDERVVANNTAISTEKSRAEGVESGLNTRLTTVEGKVDALSSATHFLGVKTELPATAANGDIVIVGNKEYVYDAASTADVKWVELGDTTAEQARIKAVEDNVADILADLGENGDTTKAIAAAQAQADKGVADAKTANDAIAVINGSGDGSIAKALADAKAYTDAREVEINKYADKAEEDAIATAKGYTDGLVKTINEAATALKSTVDTHVASEANPHKVTAEQVGLGKVENKTVAEIKTEFTGAVASGNEGFVTGGAVYTAIDDAKKAANSYTDTEVKKVADDLDAAETEISTIKNNYARVKDNQLVYGQGDAEMFIIFDCGGAN